jgi:hypothetical protein
VKRRRSRGAKATPGFGKRGLEKHEHHLAEVRLIEVEHGAGRQVRAIVVAFDQRRHDAREVDVQPQGRRAFGSARNLHGEHRLGRWRVLARQRAQHDARLGQRAADFRYAIGDPGHQTGQFHE